MTQVWSGENKKAVTRIQAGPVVVLQVKTAAIDGYSAVQVGFGSKKLKNIVKPLQGHFKNLGNFRYVREFRVTAAEAASLKVGDQIGAATFAVGDKLDLTGWTKGRGFTGPVKRYDFHGQDKTHGNKDQLRMPGSIGAGGVQRVFKGMRMAGHYGDEQVTFHNIKIVEIDEVNNVISVEGGVPGARNGLVLIKAVGELQIIQPQTEIQSSFAEATENKAEEVKPEEKLEEMKEKAEAEAVN